MSKRSQIEEHLQKLNEIGDIMRAMKNVSLMEVHKLSRFLEHQQRVVTGIDAATADFVRHYAGSLPAAKAETTIHAVALGSERGFCGDFNDGIAIALQRLLASKPSRACALGSHLTARLQAQESAVRHFAGPNTVEEVPGAIEALMHELADAETNAPESAPLEVIVLCRQDGRDDVVEHRISALSARAQDTPCAPYPPLLTEPVPAVHYQLLRHLLWARLHQIFYSSLLAEHRFRLQHMESALQRLEEKVIFLRRRQNILRQEEITEEIEVIMLNGDVKHASRRAEGGHPWQ